MPTIRRLCSLSSHSLKRKQALALAGPYDNAGALTAVIDPLFELSATIFKTLPPGSLLEKVQKTRLDTILHWSADAQRTIETAYATKLPLPTANDAELHQFMTEECDFQTEHADGSFLEHLHFCRDYAALHLDAYGPRASRVMLLHSICGVGTNCFPMRAEQLPQLASMLNAEEFAQVSAFPSVLRLLVHGPLLAELTARDAASLTNLRMLRYHRLLDNKQLELDGPQLWEALNYQLVHAIDFLPAACWQRTSNDFFFHIFTQLHSLLSRSGQLKADVRWDDASMQPYVAGARPDTWRHWAVDHLPNALVLRLASMQVARYSAAVGHDLEYDLE
eukprot:CAMPEP_0119316646 /NCGR_PEP_ID=MMETSP1333-20130426/40299_1 /TAXON_ID=418940 /ORGANISM="Scyphosphaera apsteinii, Strain RCC1455" /LENGTH=333 /DNA_ID=CAMNT_0007322345 /DNA_START=187 /DNA_END=1188 /DNA_ORIENTATION=+